MLPFENLQQEYRGFGCEKKSHHAIETCSGGLMVPDTTGAYTHSVAALWKAETILHSSGQDGRACSPAYLRKALNWKCSFDSFWRRNHCIAFKHHTKLIGRLLRCMWYHVTGGSPPLLVMCWVSFFTFVAMLRLTCILSGSFKRCCNLIFVLLTRHFDFLP